MNSLAAAQSAAKPFLVVHRGAKRQPVFLEPLDFVLYQDYLLDELLRHNVRCHAFCQMPNHVQLLLSSEQASDVSALVAALAGRFQQHFNRRHERHGALWERCHGTAPVPDQDRFWAVCHYIENNPVRRNVVSSPLAYYWSSHAHNAFGKPHGLLSHHPWYLGLADSAEGRQRAYRHLFDEAPVAASVEEIRRAARRCRPVGETVSRDSWRGISVRAQFSGTNS